MITTSYDRIYSKYRVNYDVTSFINGMTDYLDEYAAESDNVSVGLDFGTLIKKILGKIIKILTELITNIRKWYNEIKATLSTHAKNIFNTRNLRRNAIQTEIYNIDVQVKNLRTKPGYQDDMDTVALIDSLLARRNELMEQYQWLGDYYYISAEHRHLFEEGNALCIRGQELTLDTFEAFNNELEMYDYIPLLQDITASEIEREKVNVHNRTGGKINAIVSDAVAHASASTKAGGNQYYKEWTEEDQEYNDYIAMIDTYANGQWKSENAAAFERLKVIKTEIKDAKNDPNIKDSVEAIEAVVINKLTKENDLAISKVAIIEKALKKYKTICEREYKRQDKRLDIRKRGMFFTVKMKKAPQYLLKIINTLQEMVDSYQGFVTTRSSLILSVKTAM